MIAMAGGFLGLFSSAGLGAHMRVGSTTSAIAVLSTSQFQIAVIRIMSFLLAATIIVTHDIQFPELQLPSLELLRSSLKESLQALSLTIPLSFLISNPVFPVLQSIMPHIFQFTVDCLFTGKPALLTYNGPGDPQTKINRDWVNSQYSFLRATAPIGWTLDEYPFASTRQGGYPFAVGCMVPGIENLIQGGLLGVFYSFVIMPLPRPFWVVPVPI